MEELLLGIDIGTTGTKAALFNTGGKLISAGNSEYEVSMPFPGAAEQNPEDWWNALCISVRQALKKYPGSPSDIKGVAVSSQAPTLLAVDRAGKPVRPAMIWMDRRADSESDYLKEKMGEGVIEGISGNHPDPFYVASKILWYRNHEPQNFSKTFLFIQPNGYVNFKLTGKNSLDNVHASLLQLRDYKGNSWSEDLCNLCGVDPGRFPAIRDGSEILGEVTGNASALTGLRKGTPVFTGTVDGAAAALEAGALKQGVTAEMTGTSTVLLIPNDSGIIEPAFIAMPHALQGMHLLLGALVSTGASLKWFRDQLGEKEVELSKNIKLSAYDLLTRKAEDSLAGSNGLIFLPYLMGERSPIWDSNARGMFFGISLSTTKSDMIRAVLEGTSFALYHNIQVARQAGVVINEIRSVGGGTKSKLWNQIKADVLGVPVLIPETSLGAPLGDALLAGLGLGIYTDIQETHEKMFKIKEIYEPDFENHKRYMEIFNIYSSLYKNLRNEFTIADSLRKKEV